MTVNTMSLLENYSKKDKQ